MYYYKSSIKKFSNNSSSYNNIRLNLMRILNIYTLLVYLTICLTTLQKNMVFATTELRQTSLDMSTNVVENQIENQNQTQTNLNETLDAFEAFRRTYKGVEKLIYHLFSERLRYEESSGEVLEELTFNAQQSLELIGGQLVDLGDVIITDVFQRLQQQVARMKHELQHMTDKVGDTFEWAVTYLNVTVINHSEQIDNWADDLKRSLRTVNNTEVYKTSCKQVDKLVEKSSKLLQKCCSVTIKPLKSFCWRSRSLFTNTLSLLVDMLERLEFCLEDPASYDDYLMPCLNLVYIDVGNLIARAVALREKIEASIPLRLMISRKCFSVALIHIEEQQSALSRNLTLNI